MSNENDFELWKRNVYPQYWSRTSREYGLDSYCVGLIKLVLSYSPRRVFELAIGNGFPFAGAFAEKGIKVSGCDISRDLIAELNRDYPDVHAVVAGYEDEWQGSNQQFDLVYCFRATWHFRDLPKAIEFMLEKTAESGTVIFDIMNSESSWNKRSRVIKTVFFPITICKNAIKWVWNCFVPNRWMLDKVFGLREIMYSRTFIENVLQAKKLRYHVLTIHQVEALSDDRGRDSNLPADQKIIFVVQNTLPILITHK